MRRETMKYMLMFVQTDEEAAEKTLSPEDMQTIGRWFGEHAQAGRLVGGYQLSPRRTATTVKWKAGQPVVTDGPFIEGKETIGGYGIFDVADLDTAIAVAKSWPAPRHHVIEIRPIRENSMRDARMGA
jgi:hypothetical protein